MFPKWELPTYWRMSAHRGTRAASMQVVGTEHIESFLRRHPECRQDLSELVRELQGACFADPNALKAQYPSIKIIDGSTVVFKVRGNRYRLTATVAYKTQVLVVRAMQTHAEYDRKPLR